MRKLCTALFAIVLIASMQSCEKKDPLTTAKYDDFRISMRDLWNDHALWTRNVIICIVDDAPGTNDAVNRLLQNQVDIGNGIKPYFGDAAGNSLTNLLTTHITTAADLITAAKNNDTPAYNTAHDAWYANGDDIAEFLNGANPDHWDLTHWKAMMKSHLDHTISEVQARLDGNYVADVAAYDIIIDEVEMMADELSEGIALKYPDKF
jgi:hypothetical protein